MRNTFGTLFTLTTFGESHGPGIGGVIDGVPAGVPIDLDFIQAELARRRPGQSALTTARNEPDHVELLSGVWQGHTTGCPIGFLVRNTNQHSADYDNLRDTLRPSHADYTYLHKYGLRDHRGGGRSSARVTIARCVAGAVAKLALREIGVEIHAYTQQVGHICLMADYHALDFAQTELNPVRCPDPECAEHMAALIRDVKAEGDTIGGVIACVATGVPAGVGEPEAGKLHAQLAAAMMSINAAKGFEYGMGFAGVARRGSEMNDRFLPEQAYPARPNVACLLPLHTATNHSGGIQGGISNGEDIYFRVAFKPVATILQPQQTVDIEGRPATLCARGRHDPCVLPRAVPVVEAMTAITLLDNILIDRTARW